MTPSTTTYNQGDVVLVPIPFIDSEENKQRPALVLSARWIHQRGPELILVAITGTIHVDRQPDEYLLDRRDQENGGLLKESIVKTSRIFTIDRSRVIRRMGTVRHKTVEAVIQCLLTAFDPLRV